MYISNSIYTVGGSDVVHQRNDADSLTSSEPCDSSWGTVGGLGSGEEHGRLNDTSVMDGTTMTIATFLTIFVEFFVC